MKEIRKLHNWQGSPSVNEFTIIEWEVPRQRIIYTRTNLIQGHHYLPMVISLLIQIQKLWCFTGLSHFLGVSFKLHVNPSHLPSAFTWNRKKHPMVLSTEAPPEASVAATKQLFVLQKRIIRSNIRNPFSFFPSAAWEDRSPPRQVQEEAKSGANLAAAPVATSPSEDIPGSSGQLQHLPSGRRPPPAAPHAR